MAAAIGGGLLFGVMLLLSYLFGFLNDENCRPGCCAR